MMAHLTPSIHLSLSWCGCWCLTISGQLDALDREVAEDLVKTYGGRVTGSVSGKTSYVVIGSKLEDGRPVSEGKKYQVGR